MAIFPQKHCLYCGIELVLRISRDIERKKFCSRSCCIKWVKPNLGQKHSAETKRKIGEKLKERWQKGWRPRLMLQKSTQSRSAYKCVGHERVHRVIMKALLGRELRTDEHVHHIDGNKRNNDPVNLELISASDHGRKHLEEQWRRLKSRAN